MERERIAITIYIDLDPIPGSFHTEEDAKKQVLAMVKYKIPYYNPSLER